MLSMCLNFVQSLMFSLQRQLPYPETSKPTHARTAPHGRPSMPSSSPARPDHHRSHVLLVLRRLTLAGLDGLLLGIFFGSICYGLLVRGLDLCDRGFGLDEGMISKALCDQGRGNW